jgi:hypothetical protein
MKKHNSLFKKEYQTQYFKNQNHLTNNNFLEFYSVLLSFTQSHIKYFYVCNK